jgi:hypothetical protein
MMGDDHQFSIEQSLMGCDRPDHILRRSTSRIPKDTKPWVGSEDSFTSHKGQRFRWK